MSKRNSDNTPDHADPNPNPSAQAVKNTGRRKFLGGVASGALVGVAAGVGLGYKSSPPFTVIDGNKRFLDKVVLVTGGTSGIGKASVIAFARQGAIVVFCGRRENLGNDIARQITVQGGNARFVRCDVRDEKQVNALMQNIMATEKKLDIAFNNAGIQTMLPFHEMPAEVFDDMQNTNVRGVFLCMKAQLPIMMQQGKGVIIVNSSVQDFATRAGAAAYGTSKRSVVGLMRTAALEYAQHGIRVNAVCPGATDTPMVRPPNLPDAAWGVASKQWAEKNVHGMGRMGTPEEIANAVLWMASDEMSYMTGSSIVVDGGMTTAL